MRNASRLFMPTPSGAPCGKCHHNHSKNTRNASSLSLPSLLLFRLFDCRIVFVPRMILLGVWDSRDADATASRPYQRCTHRH